MVTTVCPHKSLFGSYYSSASRAGEPGHILSALVAIGEIFRVVSVAGGDDVGGQRLCREFAILHRLPETFQDHRRVLRRRHGDHGDRDQPSRRQAWWNSLKKCYQA